MTPAGLPVEADTAGRPPRAFATTHWSLVARAAEAGTAEGRAALEELCRIYWYPLYAFARSRGRTQHDAEDLTQGFFEDLLARGAIARADAARGRFRTFLLASFGNFCSHDRVRRSSLRRGGGCAIVSLEAMQEAEARFRDEPATTGTPEQIFDRKWALSLIEVTLAAVRREYAAGGKAALFDELKEVLWREPGEGGYAAIARRLGSTEGAIKMAAHRWRQRFGERCRAELAKTVMDAAEIDDELRHLFAAVRA